jgi:hypothetical protein
MLISYSNGRWLYMHVLLYPGHIQNHIDRLLASCPCMHGLAVGHVHAYVCVRIQRTRPGRPGASEVHVRCSTPASRISLAPNGTAKLMDRDQAIG